MFCGGSLAEPPIKRSIHGMIPLSNTTQAMSRITTVVFERDADDRIIKGSDTTTVVETPETDPLLYKAIWVADDSCGKVEFSKREERTEWKTNIGCNYRTVIVC